MYWTTERFLIEYDKYLKERKKQNPSGIYFISPPVEY